MNNNTIIGENLANILWEDKPKGNNDPVWRYSDNPIITRKAVTNANSIFNR